MLELVFVMFVLCGPDLLFCLLVIGLPFLII